MKDYLHVAFLCLTCVAQCVGEQPNSCADGTLRRLKVEARSGLENVIQLSHRIYSGSEPTCEDSFAEIAKLGAKTIVSVDGSLPQVELARKHGLRYVHIPIGYEGIREQAQRTLARLVHEVPGSIYFHCHHGKHRGPAAAAIAFRIDSCGTAESAKKVLQFAGTSRRYPGLWQDVGDVKRIEPSTSPLPESVEPEPLTARMASIDRITDNLEDQLRTRQAGGSDMVVLLQEAFRELQRIQTGRPEEWKQSLATTERLTQKLAGEIRAGDDLEAAQKTFALIRKQCQSCHAAYRD